MKAIRIVLFILVLVALASCNVLGEPAPIDYRRPTGTPIRWYPPAATISPVPTTTSPGGIPVSGLSEPPTLTVSMATNCRKGPSNDYDILLAFFPGETAQVIGKYTPTNYWVITTSNGYTCWIWGQNAMVAGDPNGVPEYPVPALPSPTDTSAPAPSSTDTNAPVSNPTPAPTDPPAPKPSPKPKPTPKPKPPKPPKLHFHKPNWQGIFGGNGGFSLLGFNPVPSLGAIAAF